VLFRSFISVIVVAYQIRGHSTTPTVSNLSSSSMDAGTNCRFAATWTADAGVSGYTFESNNTGAFVNDTWTPFSASGSPSSAQATVDKTLDNTIGDYVNWTFFCNNTKDVWSSAPMQTIYVESNKVLMVVNWWNTTTEYVTGNITIQLFDDMPITTRNFRDIVKAHAYDGTLFHRIVPGFVIQGGDLTSKGINWPTIQDENIGLHSNLRGTVAMAKTSNPNSATSQFYINLNDSNAGPPSSLDSNYSVFGQVISGMDNVDAISHVQINTSTSRPILDVTLVSARFVT
jgi:cyclophilin family peptidyl-prolyl cis-trans isomerase